MKQTNYQLIDFLDVDPALTGNELLWKAGAPTAMWQDGTDVVLEVPFQQQLPDVNINPDTEIAPVSYQLRLRAYGEKILRVATSFGKEELMPDSPILEMASDLQVVPLQVEKGEEEWLVKDEEGRVEGKTEPQARLRLTIGAICLPAPRETIELTFYPDGEKEIKISAYDQFFPARHDAFALAFVEKDGQADRSTLSFHIEPDEKFVGTGESGLPSWICRGILFS